MLQAKPWQHILLSIIHTHSYFFFITIYFNSYYILLQLIVINMIGKEKDASPFSPSVSARHTERYMFLPEF